MEGFGLRGLRKSKKKSLGATDPYGPQVSAMPSEYTPLVVKGGDKLPTGGENEGLSNVMPRDCVTGQTHM